MSKATRLIEEHILKPLPLPAMNKWTKVAPTVAAVTLLSLFHGGFIVDAFKQEFGELQDEPSDGSNDEDEKLGVPVNEARRWRVLARRRNMRATHFLSDPQTLWINLLWCQLARGAMTLHAQLFKNATWFSDRPQKERDRAVHLLATFCCTDSSPAQRVLRGLAAILESPDQGLSLLTWRFGPLAGWPEVRLRIVRRAILAMVGQLARKLILPWQQYPWRVWPLAVPDSSPQERATCAQDLLAAPPCCLDSGFSLKLRRMNPSQEELLRPDLRVFLETVFQRVVPTSTFIERRFAHFSHWSKNRLSWSALAAKHVTNWTRTAADAWREQHPRRVRPKHNARPAWVKRLPRTTGFNVFVGEFRRQHAGSVQGVAGRQDFARDAARAWRRKSDEEKRAFSLRARASNARRKRELLEEEEEQAGNAESETGGPWGMAELHGQWPISCGHLEKVLAPCTAIKARAAQWDEASGSRLCSAVAFFSLALLF